MEFARYNPRTDRMEAHIARQGPKGVYHIDVPYIEGASYRRAKEAAIAAIEHAIRAGKPAGEVKP